MCILYKYSCSALSTWRQVGLFNDSELVPACPNCRECQKHANILLRVNTLPQLWALKPCWFGLAVYEQFPSKHKRSFLNYLFIFLAIQHFQKNQLPPPSRPVLFHEDRRDIQGPDQNPVQRSATPSVRVEDVVTIYYGWQHICQDTVQHLRKDRSRRKPTLARLTTLT